MALASADLALRPNLTRPVPRRRRFRDVVLLVAGSSGFALTAIVAARDGIDERERVVFRAANGASLDYRAVWVPMQYGTFATVFAVLAGVAIVRSDAPGSGRGSCSPARPRTLLAKVAKRYVGRGRPATELDDVIIRGKEEGDLGFPSGHAAVSAALTTAAAPSLAAPVRYWAPPVWPRSCRSPASMSERTCRSTSPAARVWAGRDRLRGQPGARDGRRSSGDVTSLDPSTRRLTRHIAGGAAASGPPSASQRIPSS